MRTLILLLIVLMLTMMVSAQDVTSLATITPENAHQIDEIAALGYGDVRGLQWYDDGQTLAVNTSVGVYLHDMNNPDDEPHLLGNGLLPVGMPSPDGTKLAAEEDEILYLYDTATGDRRMLQDVGYCQWQFNARWTVFVRVCHRGYMTLTSMGGGQLASFPFFNAFTWTFSPDGQVVVAAGDNSEIRRLWCNGDCASEFSIRAEDDSVDELFISPDNRSVLGINSIGTSQQGYIRLWDMETGAIVLDYPLGGWISTAAFSSDGKYMVVAAGNRRTKYTSLIIWQLEDGIPTQTEPLTNLPIDTPYGEFALSLTFAPDNSWLLLNAESTTYLLETADFPTESVSQLILRDTTTAYAFHPDSTQLAYAHTDGAVRVFDITTMREANVFSGYLGGAIEIAISSDGQLLARPYGCTIELWDLSSLTRSTIIDHCLPHVEGGEGGSLRHLAFSADGHYLASTHAWEHVQTWELPTLTPIFDAWTSAERADRVAFTPQNDVIVASNFTDTTTMMHDERHSVVIEGYLSSGAELSPDTLSLASAITVDSIPTVVVWHTVSGEELLRLEYPDAPFLTDISFSPDGRFLVIAGAGSEDTTRIAYSDKRPDGGWLEIRDLSNNGERLLRLEGHTAAVTVAVFSPNGRLVASAAEDNTIRLWNVETGTELVTLTGHVGVIYDLKFADTVLISSGEDTIRFWGVPPTQE